MKLLNLVIFFVLLFSSETVKGQYAYKELDSIMSLYVKDLTEKGIDTICMYEDYCYASRSNFFILWKDNDKTFLIQRSQCRNDYPVIEISNDSIWGFFFANRDTIQREEIKIFSYLETEDGVEREEWSLHSMHDCRQSIQIMIGQDTLIRKILFEHYLEKEDNIYQRGMRKNINYDYNTNTSLKKFQLLIDRTIQRTTEGKNDKER